MIFAAFLLVISLSVLFWTYLFYPIFLSVLARYKTVPVLKDEIFILSVSIIIPTYNEEEVIVAKLNNVFNLDYPKQKVEVIIVDGRSTDRTVEIVREVSERQNRKVKVLLQEKREGEYAGTNLALKHAKGEIIFQTDATSHLCTDLLRKVVRNFADRSVGAVAVNYRGISASPESIAGQEMMYWEAERKLWILESQVDSCSTLVGEKAFRKCLVPQVESLGAGDLSVTIQIRRSGHRVVFEPEAIVRESIPTNIRDLMKQKRRRTYNTLATLIKLRKALFNRKLGVYGMIILPTHKLFTSLTPILLIMAFLGGFLYLVL